MSQDTITNIEFGNLLHEVTHKKKQGYRFVTMTCLNAGDGYDILYHFDRKYQLCTLRLHIAQGRELPSISGIFFASLLIENEIKDMFGIQIEDLAIDYGGRLLLTENAPRTPLNKQCGMTVEVGRAGPQADKGPA